MGSESDMVVMARAAESSFFFPRSIGTDVTHLGNFQWGFVQHFTAGKYTLEKCKYTLFSASTRRCLLSAISVVVGFYSPLSSNSTSVSRLRLPCSLFGCGVGFAHTGQ